uniref:Reverse transcriptase domain-containing protein n=1 Tax=Cannabis sativa TaxID=3483 RepID=A0A803PM67_CANSA
MRASSQSLSSIAKKRKVNQKPTIRSGSVESVAGNDEGSVIVQKLISDAINEKDVRLEEVKEPGENEAHIGEEPADLEPMSNISERLEEEPEQLEANLSWADKVEIEDYQAQSQGQWKSFTSGLHYWGNKSLSALVSTIGKPFMVDKVTKERSMVKFARVLVEMEITDSPPNIIHYFNEHGRLVVQGVDYEWLPVKCKNCGGFGHNMSECRKNEKGQWVKKDKGEVGKDNKDMGKKYVKKKGDIERDIVAESKTTATWVVVEEDNGRKGSNGSKKSVLEEKQGGREVGGKPVASIELEDSNAWLMTGKADMLKRVGGEKNGINQISCPRENAVKFFGSKEQGYMGSDSSVTKRLDLDCVRMGNRLNNEQQLRLIKPFSNKEIKGALFSIPSNKSPGPDGFNSEIFKVLWSEIGTEVCLAVKSFFSTRAIPVQFNETMISLVPKVEIPQKEIDYRPIACCSTIYKCITKLICKRLAEVLPDSVPQNQGAFINRSIAHNILIFQDLIKSYGKKGVSLRCAIKIDLSKAYDTIDWGFIEELLVALNFPSRFVLWIMTCLKGTSYSLMMNGRVQGHFKGRKGLRKGDSMSPLLFVLIMDYLTRRLYLEASKKTFRYHPMCKTLNLISLCFSDDRILFCKYTPTAVTHLKEALTKFAEVTRLTSNEAKSQVFFGGVKATEKAKMLDILQFSEGSFPLRCLGVPLRPTKWKREDCDVILKNIKARLLTWTAQNLSFARRTQLIQSVLLGLRNYWMSIFIIPQSIIKEVEKLCRGFLWGFKGDRSKIHLASWDTVCLAKAYGGLGFKNGSNWNKAILGKFIWALMEKHDIL